ncbi:uncharacterized protein J3D65DRAFT_173800 [Phyllosticta citribraziliensis]|uniref:CsbD-like domain-containing protein n=2 Tax=Phyllosticta TaxID=121621 RepID=A0ABR1XGX8_9PEZI
MSDKNTSTLQSYVDSATSTVQSAVGSLTGNTADKKQAADKQAEADVKHDLSHAGASAGPVDVSASGVAPKSSDRQQGSWNQTIGSAKETLGNVLGSEDLKSAGRKQNAEGQGQEAQGQVSDLGKGVGDRVKGSVGGAVAGLTGNEAAKDEYERQHDQGKTAQRGVEAELQKQAEAEKK